ncbi:hypothetical protein KJ969_01865, partial [Patescibacteria group bacterium]|nr:hypothetical protein [Patescibacteria group bacterium]MBU1922079.1 hypothetical protein [Patescibacteria group bacterium]
EGGTTDSMVSFVIATALLLAGLMIAQQTGGIMGQFAGSVAGKTKGFVGTALKGTAIGAGALLYKGAKGGAGWGDQQVRGRERMYGALSRVPGFGRFATDKVAKLRQEGGKREAEVAARIPYLTPEERERRKAAPAITAAGKVERRALRRARIEGADDDYLKSKGMDENDIIREKRKEMAALQKEATSANDIEGIKFVKEQYEKSPHLMEDEAERRKVYRTADQQAIQKMSPEARRQTEFLDEFAKRADADDVSKRIGGELRTSYLGYKSEYGANFPGAGVYKGQGKFEPAGAAGARKVFGERTKKVFVQSKLKEAEAKKAQEGAVVPASVMEKAWGEFPEVEVEKGAPSVYGGNIYRDDIREDLTDAQIVGGTAAEVWKVNSKTGQFPSKVDAASFGVELTGTDRTLFNPKSTYVERVRASRSIGSLDIDAIHASTPPGEEGYGKTVIQRLSPKTLKNAFGIARSSSPEDEQKVKAVVKAIHEKLEKELSAERIEELSPEEREMYKKTMEEMNLDPIIRRVVTGS